MQMDSSSVYPFKVQFEDIDGGGVVHHPNYLKFLERARCDALANIGLPFSNILARGDAFVIAEIQCKYLIPARHDEHLVVVSRTLSVSNSSTTVAQLIAPADKVLELLQVPHLDFFKVSKCYFKAIIRLVYIDLNILKPKPNTFINAG